MVLRRGWLDDRKCGTLSTGTQLRTCQQLVERHLKTACKPQPCLELRARQPLLHLPYLSLREPTPVCELLLRDPQLLPPLADDIAQMLREVSQIPLRKHRAKMVTSIVLRNCDLAVEEEFGSAMQFVAKPSGRARAGALHFFTGPL